MFRNYLKVALRNLKRHKIYSLINIFGLSIGMACTILILLWIQNELSYDRFHENVKDIYRVVHESLISGGYSVGTPAPLAASLKNESPDIINTVRFRWHSRKIVKCREKIFYEGRVLSADPSIFEIFSFLLIKGDPKAALLDPYSVVITEATAQKYFGDKDPMGKTLEIDGSLTTVKGIIENIPSNSHIQFNFVTPFQYLEELKPDGIPPWNKSWYTTYVQLQKNVNPLKVSQKIADLINKNRPSQKTEERLFLQPLIKIHLYNPRGGGPIKYIYIYSIIAFFILFIACINFMNLSTARSAHRAKEVGLRKVVGSNRTQLMKQFFGESIFLTFIAAFFAVLLVELFLPAFNRLSGKHLVVHYSDLRLIFGLIAVIILTGILAGTYPAVYLSSFKPAVVLKSAMKSGLKGSVFRKVLVVTQFSLSIGFIICTAVIYSQLRYMRNAELGFDKDNLVWIPVTKNIETKFESVKYELLKNSNILGVSAAGESNHGANLDWEGMDPDREEYLESNVYYGMVETDYIETVKMGLVEGRNFSKDLASDSQQAYIVNEEAVKQWEMKNPVGKQISLNSKRGTIIGVMKNLHFGFKEKMEPSIIYLSPNTPWDKYKDMFIRIRGGSVPDVMFSIEKMWKNVNPEIPFEYRFIDELIESQYWLEKQIGTIFNSITLLAIFVSCLGLFGLASFMAEKRTKEIGIRKVLGASVPSLLKLLSKEFTKWILISNIIAWPIAYFAMTKWLQAYPNRINISFWLFLFSGAFALVTALATVSYQAIKAGLANPVDSLRYE